MIRPGGKRIAFCAFLFAVCSPPGALAGASPAAVAAADAAGGLEEKVDSYLEPYLAMGGFSGAILLARGDRVLLSKGYGFANVELGSPNTPHTKFHIASVSKAFTAAAMMILQEWGLLSVRDPLTRFLPDYPGGDKITIHHLLVHASGIPNVNDFPEYETWSRSPHTTAELVALFKDKPLIFQPGERYGYSNSNYNLLAHLIERISGRRYGEFLEEVFFAPLGMRDTGHDGDPGALLKDRASGYVPTGLSGLSNAPTLDWSIKTGNGSLYSTVEDLYRWDRALRAAKPLRESTQQVMFTEHLPNVGYGTFVRRRGGRRVVRMNGRSPGFNSEIQRYVDDDVCVIVLGNNYAPTASVIADDLAAIVFGEEYKMPAVAKPARLSPEALDTYRGRYQFGRDFFVPDAVYTIERKDDHLLMKLGEWSTALVPQAGYRFFSRELWSAVSFTRADGGEVTQLVWEYGRDTYTAQRLIE